MENVSAHPCAATRPTTPSKPTIVLIVEGTIFFSEVLRDFLKLRIPKVEVHMAYTVEMALFELARKKPQLVLMDIQHPDINGVELTGRFKERSPNTLVIAMSMTGKSIAEKALANGADLISKNHLFRDLQPQLAAIFDYSQTPYPVISNIQPKISHAQKTAEHAHVETTCLGIHFSNADAVLALP